MSNKDIELKPLSQPPPYRRRPRPLDCASTALRRGKSPPSNSEAAAVGWRERSRQGWPLLLVLLLAGLMVFFAAVIGAMLFDAFVGGGSP